MESAEGCAAFYKGRSSLVSGKKDRYRLDSVWLLLQHKDLEYSAYSKLATEQKIPLVRTSPLLLGDKERYRS